MEIDTCNIDTCNIGEHNIDTCNIGEHNIEETQVKNVYEEIASHFDNTRVYKWPCVNEFLDELTNDSIVYDLGCGNGRNMINNNTQNIHFTGIDNCESFVKICKSNKLNVFNGNIMKVPLESGSADAILCIAVFHHLATVENRIIALYEMKRLLKNTGKILLSVWSINQPQKTRRSFNNYGNNIVLWNKFGRIYERFYYIFKLEELKYLFNKCGLIIIEYEYSCGNEIFTLIKK